MATTDPERAARIERLREQVKAHRINAADWRSSARRPHSPNCDTETYLRLAGEFDDKADDIEALLKEVADGES